MGLLSGGGVFGSVGTALGINTSGQQKAIQRSAEYTQLASNQAKARLNEARHFSLQQLGPYQQEGTDALRSFGFGSDASGFGQNISELANGGALDSLIGLRQRGADSAFAKAGLTRSGGAIREAANIPADVLMQIEQMLSSRQEGLAGIGLNAATQRGQFETGTAINIANNYTQSQAAINPGIIEQSNLRTQGLQNTFGMVQGGLSGYGKGSSLGGIGTIGGVIGGMLSDIRLKTHIKPVDQYKDLTVYEWEWIDGMPEELKAMNTGFIAQEVQEKYPQFTGDLGGYITIDYERLLEHLDSPEGVCLH